MDKKWLFFLGSVIVVLLAFYFYRKYRVAPTISFNALNLVDMENKPVKFGQLKGKKAVVFFSASWCPNCLTELEEINSVSAQLEDVNIIVISDEPLEKVRDFAERKAYPFIFLKMDQPFHAIGINSIPTSYILNTDQQVIRETVGYMDWKDISTREPLKRLMDE